MSTVERYDHFIANRLGGRSVHPDVALGVSAVVVLVVAIGDALTGPYLAFSTFYLLPVVFASWFGRRGRGLLIALFAALTGVATTLHHPGQISTFAVAWNGTFRFATYALMAMMVDAERSAQSRIVELSTTDPLTGLLNRREFERRCEAELARAGRSNTPLALFYIDLDDLKTRNDTLGHVAGDAMILDFTSVARTTFRETDLLARIGGDEFCFLIVGADNTIASDIAQRLLTSLKALDPNPISASIGVIAGHTDRATSINKLMNDADALMYQAKQSGKGAWKMLSLGTK